MWKHSSLIGVILLSCSAGTGNTSFTGRTGSPTSATAGSGGTSGVNLDVGGSPNLSVGASSNGGSADMDEPVGPFTDFPATPIFDFGATPGDDSLFDGATESGAGPCLIEPQLGALLPRNWLRPRFRWIADSSQNSFELRLHADNQTRDLLVYTTVTSWIMPRDLWDALRKDSSDRPITVTVRAGTKSGSTLSGVGSASGPITIAPVEAPGTIVYWTSGSGNSGQGSALKGFKMGDEGVNAVLTPTNVPQAGGCIGCHSSSPDGAYAILSLGGLQYADSVVGVQADNLGQPPPFLGEGARQALLQPQRGAAAVSPAHWSDGDHVIVTSFHSGNEEGLSFIDLEAQTLETATGLLAHNHEPPPPNWPTDFGQVAPAWSHDGNELAYVSAKGFVDGRVEYGPADIYVVPYNDKAGGDAVPLLGADDPNFTETYPAYTPDDSYIAFNRVPGVTRPYAEPSMEVFVVPRAGGAPWRIEANDPPACSGKTSPGVSNTWPHWSPRVAQSKGRTYYWLVFSSTRYTTVPQLYLSPVVLENGALKSYPALYFWNQIITESNHTPAWDTFNIPPVPMLPPPDPPQPPPK